MLWLKAKIILAQGKAKRRLGYKMNITLFLGLSQKVRQ
jgi:hypothetical protein